MQTSQNSRIRKSAECWKLHRP